MAACPSSSTKNSGELREVGMTSAGYDQADSRKIASIHFKPMPFG